MFRDRARVQPSLGTNPTAMQGRRSRHGRSRGRAATEVGPNMKYSTGALGFSVALAGTLAFVGCGSSDTNGSPVYFGGSGGAAAGAGGAQSSGAGGSAAGSNAMAGGAGSSGAGAVGGAS